MPEQTPGQTLTQMKKRCYSEPGRRSVRRPEDIQRDVRGLKLRQRVTAVLNDDFIRHELEDTLGSHGAEADEYLNESVRAYQDFLVPSSGFYGGAVPGLSAVFPINDIRGTDTLNYTKTERNLRCKLASAYRLVDLFGWSRNIHGNLTVRCPAEHGRTDNFLIKPLDLLYSEVSASNLIKVDAEGSILDGGSTNFGISGEEFWLNSAIHMSRRDAKCVIHIHERSAVAVAASKHGILPISHPSLLIGQISYHDYEGVSCEEGEKGRLGTNFQPGSKVLVLRNHGLLCIGETIEEALYYANNAVMACSIQVQAMPGGVENLVMLKTGEQNKAQEASNASAVGVKEFEAWMRMLDSQGYRTGYVYRNPDLFNKYVPEPKSEGKSPATMSSMRYEMMFGGNNQMTPLGRARSRGKGNTYKNRAEWLNSPVKGTEYKKEIIHDNHSEAAILKDSRPEKDTAVKILEESKSSMKENAIQENITRTDPASVVMSEIPLDDLFNSDEFVEKGLNDAETKEIQAKEVITTEVKTIEVAAGPKDAEDGNMSSKHVVTTTTTTTVVNDVTAADDNAATSNESNEATVEEKADEGSDNGGEQGKSNDDVKGASDAGKHGQKAKKKKSFKKAFQGMVHRRNKSDKDEDEEKS